MQYADKTAEKGFISKDYTEIFVQNTKKVKLKSLEKIRMIYAVGKSIYK